jgi:Tfp pilus assembly protein PilO
MAGLPTTRRDQSLLAIGVVAIIAAAAYWYLLDAPAQQELTKQQTHLDSLNASNQRAKAQLARGSVKSIKDEADSLRANLVVLRSLVPAENEVNALVDQVSDAARRARLELSGIDPEPRIEGEMFDAYRTKVRLNGATYHDIGHVLTNIASLNRVISPINLSLQLGNPPGGKAVPGKQYLNATFELQTYVVRTTPKAAPKPAAKPAAEKPAAEK